MADGDVPNTAIDTDALQQQLLAQIPQNQPSQPQLAQQPAPQQAQAPQAKMTAPNIVRLIAGLINPQSSMAGMQQQPGGRPPSRADAFENFMGSMIYSMGQGFAQMGHGPGANARGFGAAVTAPSQRDLQQFQLQQQAQANQAQIQSEQAKTQQTQAQTGQIGKTVTLPNGMTLPLVVAQQYLKGGYGADTKRSTDALKAGYRYNAQGEAEPIPEAELSLTDRVKIARERAQNNFTQAQTDLAKAHQDVLMNPNNPTFRQKEREIQSRLAIAQTGLMLHAQSNNLRAGEMAEKVYDPALQSDVRLLTMRDNLKDALNGNQQAMLSLMANHVGMTLGLQRNARITKDFYNEAAESQPWLKGIAAKFDSDGYLTGVTLNPDQMKQMVDLAEKLRPMAWQKARSAATAAGIGGFEPQPLPGLGPVPQSGFPQSAAPTPSRVPARGGGNNIPLSTDKAREFLQQAGGDKDKARALAKKQGFKF